MIATLDPEQVCLLEEAGYRRRAPSQLGQADASA
jgi:hypothetical protein